MSKRLFDAPTAYSEIHAVTTSWNLEKLIFILLIAIQLVPIWVFPYFPTQDGPAHVDNAAALRYYFNPDEHLLHQYYTLNLRLVPNWVTNLTLAGLIGFVSPIVAEKILISGYIVLLPISIRYSLGAISEDARFLSLLAFPLIYNDFLHRGFYNFIYSIPVFFFVIGYWLRHRESLRLGEIFCLASLILLLYFCHIVSFGVLVITLFILAFSLTIGEATANYKNTSDVLQGSWRLFCNRTWASLLIGLAPAIVLAVRFVFQQGSFPRESRLVWPDYSWKFFAWPFYGVTAITNTPGNLLISASVSLLFVILFFYSMSQRASRQTTSLSNGLICAVVAICVLYLAAPFTVSGGTILNPRFVLLALLLSILWFGTHRFSEQAKFTIGTVGAVLAVLQIAFNLPVYAKINDDAAEYLSAGKVIEKKGTLLSFCFANEGCGIDRAPGYLRTIPFDHLSGYISAEKHLVNLFNVDSYTNFFPIRYRDELNPFPYLWMKQIKGKRIWAANVAEYSKETRGRIDYVLLWGISDAKVEDTSHLVKWLGENYELIFTSATRQLQVYRRK